MSGTQVDPATRSPNPTIGVSAGAALRAIAGLVELPGALVGLTTTSVLAFVAWRR
jgi:hypothetical protein